MINFYQRFDLSGVYELSTGQFPDGDLFVSRNRLAALSCPRFLSPPYFATEPAVLANYPPGIHDSIPQLLCLVSEKLLSVNLARCYISNLPFSRLHQSRPQLSKSQKNQGQTEIRIGMIYATVLTYTSPFSESNW